jgi:hypothetical protein
MNREPIKITEFEGGEIEVKVSGSSVKIKKNFDEVDYYNSIRTFFESPQMLSLTKEEQIIARGYLAWSYFWPRTIYKELFFKYPLEKYEYKCAPETDLCRYLLWSQTKSAWNPLHWAIYFMAYLPFLRLRLSLFVDTVLVGFSIDDERWHGFSCKNSLKIGGGKWRIGSWFNSAPLLHPRKFPLTTDINQKLHAHIRNMNLSKYFLGMVLPRQKYNFHFWDDFNYSYPLLQSAHLNKIRIHVHQHAPSFTRIHVTGQILSLLNESKGIEWYCWDQDWLELAQEMNNELNISLEDNNLPFASPIPLNSSGAVVFPWESFCDNSLKKNAINHSLECGLSVAIKLRSGYSRDLQIMSFGFLNWSQIEIVTDWSELNNGVRAIVGAQTSLLYHPYLQNVPTFVMVYLSETYKSLLRKKISSSLLVSCESEQKLFLALQELPGKTPEHF